MKSTFFKRRYYEFRMGTAVMSPIMSMSTFIGVAYLYIQDIMPIYVFVPIFIIAMGTLLVVVGSQFKQIQLSTDINIGYAKSTESARTQLHVMDAQIAVMKKLDIEITEQYMERYNYIKEIAGQP